ncbi:MAG: aldo/keto reductase [Robiginitomaculum sp.]|nr:MAG: aldo/keto reductase [Robiginitomaculum sp.]
MRIRNLGRTDIKVSNICLGSMTWGEQNTQSEGHEQLDYALERGINFIDTAELYAIPPKPETQGSTETIIGTWLNARNNRDKVVIATKVVGRTDKGNWFRDGGISARQTKAQIDFAVERSLKNLQTDYIDLYQLHWPDREHEGFGFHTYIDPDLSDMTPLEDILEALSRHVDAGRIRAIGLSNESPWGTMKFLALAEKHGWPRMASIQNAYNLISRRFDYGLAEIAMREDVSLLAYSPLAQGYLTGKYENGALPEGARKTLFKRLDRYEKPWAAEAVTDCLALSKELGITPIQLALKFTDSRPFTTSTIIGATTMAQLKDDIDAFDLDWTDEIDAAVHELHVRLRSPCP